MANLIQPRVRVTWGDINLSKYNGPDLGFPQDEPVVYDIQADLTTENEGPGASMKWNPTGPAMAVYQYMLENYMDRAIIVEFFFSGGKKMPLTYMWSGQSINYGNDMSITVKMVTELAGKINGNIRSTAQAYDEKTGADPFTVLNKATKQYGVTEDIYKYNAGTVTYWKKAKIQNMYGNDWTLGNNAAQIAKQMGDTATGININGTSIVFFPPFSYKKTEPNVVLIATTTFPDPVDVTKRYGFLLGPGIFDSLTREVEWKPPQQDNKNNPGTQALARRRDPVTGQFLPSNPSNQERNVRQTAVPTSSPLGTTNNRANLSIQNQYNPEGPTRSNAINDEKVAKLSLDTLMCPLLCGIKPHDILYVPNFKGDFIEDWIVNTVDYSQNNGQINVSIQATRVYGQGTPMNKPEADKFLAYAKQINLVGESATLQAWEDYAWRLPDTASAPL